MSHHDDTLRLRHVLEHAREAIALARDRTRSDLDADRLFGLGMTRLLEIIGEAAGRVSAGTRARLPDIPWADVVGLRNRIIHGYDSVDFDVMWDVIQLDLPPLAATIARSFE